MVDAVTESLRQLEPGVSLSTIAGGSGQLLRRIEAEVFWSSHENLLGAFRQLFEPYRSKELSAIPGSLHQKEYLWSATITHVVVAMESSNLLGEIPAPKCWADFLDPKWKGKVAIADPNNSSTASTILWGIEQLMGKECLCLCRGGTGGNRAGLSGGGHIHVAGVHGLDRGRAQCRSRPTYHGRASGEGHAGALLENTFRRPSRSDIVVSDHVDLPGLDKIKIFATNEADAAAGREALLAH